MSEVWKISVYGIEFLIRQQRGDVHCHWIRVILTLANMDQEV
jgi:hypothetical protein